MQLNEQKILEIIKEMPAFQEVLKQQEEREHLKQERSEAIRARQEILNNWQDAFVEERAIIADADAEIAAADKARESAVKKRSAANNSLGLKSHERHLQLADLEYILLHSAPGYITMRLEELNDELENARQEMLTSAPSIPSAFGIPLSAINQRKKERQQALENISRIEAEIKATKELIYTAEDDDNEQN